MRNSEFLRLAQEAGFDVSMSAFLLEHVSQKPHTHTAEQITDFGEAVADAMENIEEAEEEDADDDER